MTSAAPTPAYEGREFVQMLENWLSRLSCAQDGAAGAEEDRLTEWLRPAAMVVGAALFAHHGEEYCP